MTSELHLPSEHRAIVLEDSKDGFHVRTVSTPSPVHGSAVVRILQASVLSYHREIYDGTRQYDFPTPIVGGLSAVGRIAAVGPDATSLTPGQLVWVDCVIRGRDDPDSVFLSAIHEGGTTGSRKLIKDVWRNGTFAEYARFPLENLIPLSEECLCKQLGYSVADLAYLSNLLVAYGGLRDIRLEPGETIIVCPATGAFGGAGVAVAAAMGARVIAMGRNEIELARLKNLMKKSAPGAEIETVKMTGDVKIDTAALQAFGTVDAVLDFTPPQAKASKHLGCAINSLRKNGRVSLMGFVMEPLPAWKVVADNISFKGKLMYEREDMVQFVKMLERGLFAKGKEFVEVKSFALEKWNEAFDEAAIYAGIGRLVTIAP